MTCCTSESCEGTNRFFSRWSRTYARRFSRKGLEKIQKYLLEGVKRSKTSPASVLDIGCGVGALHLRLLKDGASSAVGVDVSEGMLEQARKLSGEQGLQDRVTYILGDFVQHAPTIQLADVTVMDKVVCCYEDLPSLVEHATSRTRVVYGLTHPRNIFVVKAVFKTQIFFAMLFRAKFRPFWHDWESMKQMIVERGFRLIYERPTIAWNAVVFERV